VLTPRLQNVLHPRFCLAIAAALLTFEAAAEERYESPRSLGMGSALRGAAAANAALFTNPAGLAATKLFHLEGAYQFQSELEGHAGHASVVDSTTPVSGGFGATYFTWDPEFQNVSGYDMRITLAFPASDMFFIGATGKYLDLQAGGVPEGALPSEEPGSVARGITFDAGAMVRLGQLVSLGVSGYNLRRLPGDQYPQGIGGGIGFAPFDLLLIDFDVVYDLPHEGGSRGRYLGGLEYFAGGQYPVRLGYRYSEKTETDDRSQDLTAGLGYVDPRFAVDLGGRRQVRGGDETVVSAALRIFAN